MTRTIYNACAPHVNIRFHKTRMWRASLAEAEKTWQLQIDARCGQHRLHHGQDRFSSNQPRSERDAVVLF